MWHPPSGAGQTGWSSLQPPAARGLQTGAQRTCSAHSQREQRTSHTVNHQPKPLTAGQLQLGAARVASGGAVICLQPRALTPRHCWAGCVHNGGRRHHPRTDQKLHPRVQDAEALGDAHARHIHHGSPRPRGLWDGWFGWTGECKGKSGEGLTKNGFCVASLTKDGRGYPGTQ